MHLVFSDLCLFGASKGGIVNIVNTLKLPIPASLLKLGSDGCGKAYPPVEDAFPRRRLRQRELPALGLQSRRGARRADHHGIGRPRHPGHGHQGLNAAPPRIDRTRRHDPSRRTGRDRGSGGKAGQPILSVGGRAPSILAKLSGTG